MPKKLSDATRSQKTIALYIMLLYNRRRYSLAELADALQCSKQTVLKCVQELQDGSVQIHVEKSGKEHVYWLDSERVPKETVTAEDIATLLLCRDLMVRLLPEKQRQALYRLTAHAVPANYPAARCGEQLGMLVTKGAASYDADREQLDTILEAIQRRCLCHITYRKFHNEEKEYDFAPFRMESLHDVLYVRGFIVEYTGRTYKAKYESPTVLMLKRVSHVENHVRRLWSSTQFPPLEHPDEVGMFGVMGGQGVVSVVIRFSPRVAPYVRDRQWSRQQSLEEHEDGGLTLTMGAKNIEEVAAWTLSFGPEAEVLAPAALREDMRGKAADLLALYAQDESLLLGAEEE